jgi:hypothetical protein
MPTKRIAKILESERKTLEEKSQLQQDKFRRQLEEIGQRTHAGTVLLLVAQLEGILKRRLIKIMPNNTPMLDKKLFHPSAPLGPFSVKIDLAYLLGIINEELHHTLHTMREIRNAFPYPQGPVHFNLSNIKQHLSDLGWKEGVSKEAGYDFFSNKVQECWEKLWPTDDLDAFVEHLAKLYGGKTK